MERFMIFLLIGLFVLGCWHTHQVGKELRKAKEKGIVDIHDLSNFKAFDLACLLVFGPFVIVIRRITRKLGWK